MSPPPVSAGFPPRPRPLLHLFDGLATGLYEEVVCVAQYDLATALLHLSRSVASAFVRHHRAFGTSEEEREQNRAEQSKAKRPEDGGGGRGVLMIVHGRSRMTIDPRIPTMPGRSMSGFTE